MYVKTLKVAGFKSFADPTLLEFVPGVNVIVGPNGSGKSNIADALQWVLGSQAPSSLRGASMEDVIFAGAQGRPRLGMAEVELTLDNGDRALPLDLNEVTITRSAGRDGSSEYRINGAPCRLLDVAELLSDTGIGRSIHTVVGQGQLDAVLQARPEDRRALIEEAAQIGKYRRRKDRAVRKIERVDDNLTRLNDVLSELRRALRPLKRQASEAARYSELIDEQRTLRQRLAATDVARLAREAEALDAEGEARRASLLADELSSVRARLGAAADERTAVAAAADRARGIAHRTARAAERLGGLARLAEERAETIAARLAAETEEGYRERIRFLETERDRFAGELVRLSEIARERRAAAQAAASEARSFDARLEEAEQKAASARGLETAAAQELVRAEGTEAAGRATLGSIEARTDAVLERRHAASRDISAAASEVEKAETELAALEAEMDVLTRRAAETETRLEEARAEAERVKDRLGADHAARAAAAARVEALQEVEALLADHPEARRKVLPLVDDARSALELASAGEEEARRILGAAEDEVERWWQAVASDDEELRRLDAVMTGAAERLAGARRRREKREVELAAFDEELARAREALAAAERAAADARAELPAKRAALEEASAARSLAEGELRRLRAAGAEAAEGAARAEVEARTAEERMLGARLRGEEAEAAIADAEQALAGLEDLRLDLVGRRERVLAIRRAAAEAAATAAEWARGAEDRAAHAREAAEAADARLTSLRERERELAQRLEELVHRRNQAEVQRAQNEARAEAIGERALEEWGLSLDALRALPPFEEAEETAARERVEALDRSMRRLGAVNPRAAEEYAELAERESFLEDQIADLKASRRDLMKVVREVDETIVTVFGDAFRDVAREFEEVFGRLFPGGSGRLTLTNPDDLLTSGVEVEARPPGKNVRKLSLLSGGERSLVALAFLFAIFRSRPSPFYLLDEVEAALDDINLQRFLGLIAELEERAQVLIVTHQKRTMEAADVLYGVSMAKDGVSRVLAMRIEDTAVSSA